MQCVLYRLDNSRAFIGCPCSCTNACEACLEGCRGGHYVSGRRGVTPKLNPAKSNLKSTRNDASDRLQYNGYPLKAKKANQTHLSIRRHGSLTSLLLTCPLLQVHNTTGLSVRFVTRQTDTMSTNQQLQRSMSALSIRDRDSNREKSYFEQQREALIGEIAMVCPAPSIERH